MNDDEKRLDAYLRLYDRQMTHYERTQGIEWKVSIGIWTLLAAAIYWASDHSIEIETGLAMTIVVVLVVVVPLVHGAWLRLMHASEEFDKDLWVHYRGEVDTLLGTSPPTGKASVSVRLWWLTLELMPTVVLAIALAWVLLTRG